MVVWNFEIWNLLVNTSICKKAHETIKIILQSETIFLPLKIWKKLEIYSQCIIYLREFLLKYILLNNTKGTIKLYIVKSQNVCSFHQ